MPRPQNIIHRFVPPPKKMHRKTHRKTFGLGCYIHRSAMCRAGRRGEDDESAGRAGCAGKARSKVKGA
jgi:hypothetical protein